MELTASALIALTALFFATGLAAKVLGCALQLAAKLLIVAACVMSILSALSAMTGGAAF